MKPPKKPVIFCEKDGGSYRAVYTPIWRPGQQVIGMGYGYWSAYQHNPDGTVTSCSVNLSQCQTFEDVVKKLRKYVDPKIKIFNAHKYKSKTYPR